MKKILICLSVLMLMAPCVAVAQGGNDDIKENDFNPVNTGVTTLGIAPDTRGTGIGGYA